VYVGLREGLPSRGSMPTMRLECERSFAFHRFCLADQITYTRWVSHLSGILWMNLCRTIPRRRICFSCNQHMKSSHSNRSRTYLCSGYLSKIAFRINASTSKIARNQIKHQQSKSQEIPPIQQTVEQHNSPSSVLVTISTEFNFSSSTS
jgi:hypothetical protein